MKKLCVLACVFVARIVEAATPPPVSNGSILPGPTTTEMKQDSGRAGILYLTEKIGPGLSSSFLTFAFIMAVLFVVVGGITYVISLGDSDMIAKAKQMILWAVVGVVVALLSYTIVHFIVHIQL